MQRFTCKNCLTEVYFDNTVCLNCKQALGYLPEEARFLSSRADRDAWHSTGDDHRYRACGNRAQIGCNWLVAEDAPDGALCEACAHNRTIPDTSQAENVERWTALETAKRTLFYSLMRWGLPRPTRSEDPDHGLAFDFLADTTAPDGTVQTVLTGHDEGLITLNIAEGDDAERERRRTQLGEPYRTLIGHMRHEVGHYYWDVLVRDGGRLDAYRDLFGDEREDYGEALQRHYETGAPEDWQASYISTYATAHAWEDFAETWAHYIHMVDALETAHAFGMVVGAAGGADETSPAALDPYREGTIDDLLARWMPLTVAVNSLSRSLGQQDLYPFVLSDPVVRKLGFIHEIVRAGR